MPVRPTALIIGVAIIALVIGYVAGYATPRPAGAPQTVTVTAPPTTVTQTVTAGAPGAKTVTVTHTVTQTITSTVSITPPPPKKLRVAVIYVTPIEEPWNMALHQAMKWAEENLNIEYTYVEKVHEADVERVIRQYVAEGYKVIFPHSWGYNEVTRRIAKEFPDVLFCQGSGPVNVEWPPNVILYDYWIQDAAFVAGAIAGLMTKTNKIGVIAGYAVPDVNRLVNAFIAGAKHVNPKVEPVVTFIESWFDPEKAKEAAKAQIDAGVDMIYAERYGVFEAVKEAQEAGKKVYAFGNIVNQNDLAPSVVLGSVVWDLRPFVKYVVDMVRSGKVKGGIISWGMKEGWAKFVWNDELKSKVVPSDVASKIDKIVSDIMSGKIKVPIYEEWKPERWK